MKKIFKKFISVFLSVCVLTGIVFSGTSALAQVSENSNVKKKVTDSMEIHYWDILKLYESKGYNDYNGENIEIPVFSFVAKNKPKCEPVGGRKAVLWEKGVESISFNVNVEKPALYGIELDYYALNDKSTDIQRSFLLDGKLICQEWNELRFQRIFKDTKEVQTDGNGDQTSKRLEQVYAWQTVAVSDYEGYFSGPMKLYLSKGKHTLTFSMSGNQPMAIGGIRLVPPENLSDYKGVYDEYASKGYTPSGEIIKAEGEDTLYRSSASLRSSCSSDLNCTPFNMKNKVVNVVGGDLWSNGRQSLSWEIDVDKEGLYKLALNLYTYYNYGIPVYRRIAVDGKVPFKEFAAYRFYPDTKWRTEVLSDENDNPYLLYLSRGKHIISMSVVAGDYTDIIAQLDNDMDVLSDLFLKITFITTTDPDTNYDYQLDEKIPGLLDTMKYLYNSLDRLSKKIKGICKNDKALNYSEMRNTMDELKMLIKDVYEIPSNLSQFTTILTKYGEWIDDLKSGSLTVDSLQFISSDKEFQFKKASFLKKISYSIVSFLSTFTKDYNSVLGAEDGNKGKEVIDVWYGGSQLNATEIQNFIKEDFTKQSDIGVRFKLTPADQMATGINAMLLAILSGTAPDAVLNAASIEDYLMRNQCYDISKFDDYSQISKRFLPAAITPLTYKGGVYGLPLTMDVTVMFYRTDIFKKKDISVPNTWNDMVTDVIPKLAESSMTLAQSPGFEILLFQNNGELYNRDMTKTLIASKQSWKAFKMHCDFYTMYGVPRTSNFFNRFRSGETPVGFGKLADYIQFVYAAPEIAGRWAIAPIPGILQSDGTINRNIGGILSTSSMIMADAKHKNEAWEFLKWFTGAKVQVELSEQIEAKINMSARLFSATVEAFEALDWNQEHLDVFMKSLEQTKAYNPVLGGYYLNRYITYAFNNVVISKSMTEREALEYAQKNINNELVRRRNSIS